MPKIYSLSRDTSVPADKCLYEYIYKGPDRVIAGIV